MNSPSAPKRTGRRPWLFLLSGLTLLAAFAIIAIGVKRQFLFVETDTLVRDVLHENAIASPGIAAAFTGLTELASRPALAAEAAALLLVLLVMRKWRMAFVWFAAFAGNGAAMFIKSLFDRHRPIFDSPLVKETSASFPSGHAVGSAILCGMLAYLCIAARPRRWLLFTTLFISVIALIDFSRIYIGAHWFSDVLAGNLFGLGWLMVCLTAARVEQRGD